MNEFLSKPSRTSVYILSFAVSLAAGVFAGQQPDTTQSGSTKSGSTQSDSSKTDTTTSKSKMSSKDTGSRNRVSDTTSLVGGVDQKFMMDAAKGGMMEVQLGQTAQQKASSDSVKEFGKKMEQDHGQANKELTDLAKAKNISLPTDMGSEKSSMDKLSGLSGAAFDKAYVRTMVRDHKKDVKEFERESTNGMDSDVKAFAAKTLPTLKEHLRMAEELERSTSGKPAKASASSDSSSSSSTPSSTPKKDQ